MSVLSPFSLFTSSICILPPTPEAGVHQSENIREDDRSNSVVPCQSIIV